MAQAEILLVADGRLDFCITQVKLGALKRTASDLDLRLCGSHGSQSVVVLFLRGQNRSLIREVRLKGIIHLLLAYCAILHERRITLDIQLSFHLSGFSAVDLGLSCIHVCTSPSQFSAGNLELSICLIHDRLEGPWINLEQKIS